LYVQPVRLKLIFFKPYRLVFLVYLFLGVSPQALIFKPFRLEFQFKNHIPVIPNQDGGRGSIDPIAVAIWKNFPNKFSKVCFLSN
jgi:hypothetical protein